MRYKLKLPICILALSSVAGAEKPSAAVETNVVGQVVLVERFNRFQYNGAYYAWVEVPLTMLSISAPAGTKNGSLREKSNNKVVRQKNMSEFMLPATISIDGKYCLAPIARMDLPTHRVKSTTRDDMIKWESLMAPYGLSVTTWLSLDQYRERISSEMYSTDI